jgi:AraC-like DNA-binding protein
MDPLHFLHWRRMPQCDSRVEKYFEGYCSLQLISRGHAFLSYGEEGHLLGATTFWFHYPGPFIRLRPDRGPAWDHRYVAFKGPLMERWRRQGLVFESPLACPADRRAGFVSRFDQMLAWLDTGGNLSEHKARAALELMLWELKEIRLQPSLHGSLLDTLAEFAQERQFRVGGYGVLAKKLGMSLSTLRRRVRETAGETLHAHTRNLRAREARRLLRETDKPLAEVAEILGFTDVYYFNREFKRLAGMTPGTYRRSLP